MELMLTPLSLGRGRCAVLHCCYNVFSWQLLTLVWHLMVNWKVACSPSTHLPLSSASGTETFKSCVLWLHSLMCVCVRRITVPCFVCFSVEDRQVL